jgi:hypothetical protein
LFGVSKFLLVGILFKHQKHESLFWQVVSNQERAKMKTMSTSPIFSCPIFAGTHRFIGLQEATPRNIALEKLRIAEHYPSEVFAFQHTEGVHRAQGKPLPNGFEIALEGDWGNGTITEQIVIEDNRLGRERKTSGDKAFVELLDFLESLHFKIKAKQMNEAVPDRLPGEEAKYTFTAETK